MLLASLILPTVVLPATPAFADQSIYGEGSTWSFPAIQDWQAAMAAQGETVNYDEVGSTAGRVAFYNAQADFAVSEIPFQPNYCTPTVPPVCDNEQQLVQNSKRSYLYMPIVAGGTSVGYNLQINGSPFRNLKLDSAALAGIFTGSITYWDNPAIKADNPGVNFPHIPVHPVGRSDGSGTSYQFSAYLAAMQPAATQAYCARLGLPSNCLPTSQWPNAPGMTLQNGSDGVANYVTASYANGAIGYAEYAYWIERGAPVASVKNASGNFVQPTAVNDAVALTKALINSDHTQNLSAVYINSDPRTYPISSYSYMIVPTNDVKPMDPAKGTTLSKFILYFLCQGQQAAAPLGYSPLPPNLVQLGFEVNDQIPGAVQVGQATPANCNNPTLHGYLQANGIVTGPSSTVPGKTSSGGSSSGSSSSGTVTRNSTSSSGSGAGTSSASKGTTGSGTAASNTGASNSNASQGASSSTTTTVPPQVSAKNIQYAGAFTPAVPAFSALVLALIGLCIVAPPAVGMWRWRRRSTGRQP